MTSPGEPHEELSQEQFLVLLHQAKQGSPVALGELLEHSRQLLLSLAEASLDSSIRPKVGASDLVQESLLKASQNLEQFRGQSEPEFRAWLKRILINHLMNCYREWKQSQKRQLVRELPLTRIGVDQQALPDSSSPSPSAFASHREEIEKLHQAMNRLSPDYREVLELRNREDLGFEEIGQRMNRSTDAARMLWYRAFEQLSKELGQVQ